MLSAHAAGRAPIFMTKTWRRLPWSSPSRGEPSVWLVMGMGVATGLKNVCGALGAYVNGWAQVREWQRAPVVVLRLDRRGRP